MSLKILLGFLVVTKTLTIFLPTIVLPTTNSCWGRIRVSDLPNARRKKVEANIPHAKSLKDYPAVLVARLGVSLSFRSNHIGSDVLENIKYWFLDPYNKTGCRYVLVDAYNSPSTIRFYESNGFATVFSSEEQEKEYRHIAEERPLNTRLMYFDLMPLAKDNK